MEVLSEDEIRRIVEERGSFAPLLPLLLNLKGKPYHIRDHFVFEPFFRVRPPRKLVYMTGRQVAKSTSLAAQGVIQSAVTPHFATLYVLPQFEMTRRFSSNYVRPFIEESAFRSHLSCVTNTILQRQFKNQSTLHFSFVTDSVNRTRGLSCDKTCYDEVQLIPGEAIPIVRETMSASPWMLEQYTGTPLTLDNILTSLWTMSSQAEWVIRCEACNHWNIPSAEHDLDRMTGPDVVTREISEDQPGVVCAKCGRPIYPRKGRWVHRYPERKDVFEGYHVPQHILPMHYANPEKWRTLLGKRRGAGNTPIHVYYNECCGEPYDVGSKLVSIEDLKRVAVLHPNRLDVAKAKIAAYKRRVLGVDWGGGGEQRTSFTTAAVVGMLPNGRIDVLYGWRSLTPHDYAGEAAHIHRLMGEFQCTHIVHDYSGAGAVREGYLISLGIPPVMLAPVAYVSSRAGFLMQPVPENPQTLQRAHYRLNKGRSLLQTCEMIRRGWIRFFQYDYVGPDEPGLLHDFLALVEDKSESRLGSDVYSIVRSSLGGPDDFAHAVNLAVCALCYQEGRWPDFRASPPA